MLEAQYAGGRSWLLADLPSVTQAGRRRNRPAVSAAEAAGPAENGRPFPAGPWKTGKPVSHSYRSHDGYWSIPPLSTTHQNPPRKGTGTPASGRPSGKHSARRQPRSAASTASAPQRSSASPRTILSALHRSAAPRRRAEAGRRPAYPAGGLGFREGVALPQRRLPAGGRRTQRAAVAGPRLSARLSGRHGVCPSPRMSSMTWLAAAPSKVSARPSGQTTSKLSTESAVPSPRCAVAGPAER